MVSLLYSRLRVESQLSYKLLQSVKPYCNPQPQKQAAPLTERNNRLTNSLSYRDPHLGVFWGLGLLLGYFATSCVKSDGIFLLSNPDFLYRQNIAPILLCFLDTMRDIQIDRQTDNRHDDCYRRLLHLQCASLIK